jgi:hypothetical protein
MMAGSVAIALHTVQVGLEQKLDFVAQVFLQAVVDAAAQPALQGSALEIADEADPRELLDGQTRRAGDALENTDLP